MGLPVIVLAIWATVFALLAFRVAVERSRTPVLWAAFGGALGPIALLILALAPPGRCSVCGSRATGWLFTCLWCGNDLRTSATVASMPAPVDERLRSPARPAAVDRSSRPAGQVTPAPYPPGDIRAPREGAARLHQAEPAEPTPVGYRRSHVTAIESRMPLPLAQASEPREAQLLASGVYVTGTEPLVPGARYIIARSGDLLHVLGPVEKDPTAIAVRHELAHLEVEAVGDRLLLAGTHPGRKRFALVFQGVSGMTIPDVARGLAVDRIAAG